MTIQDLYEMSPLRRDYNLAIREGDNIHRLEISSWHDKSKTLFLYKIFERYEPRDSGHISSNYSSNPDALSRWRKIGTDLLDICADGMEELIAWGKGRGAK